MTGRAAILAAEMFLDGDVPAAMVQEAADGLEHLERKRVRRLALPPDLALVLAVDDRLADGFLEPEDLDLLLEEMVCEAEIHPDLVTTPAYAWAREQVRLGEIPCSEVQGATFVRDRALAAEDQASVRCWIASRTSGVAVRAARPARYRTAPRRRMG